MPISITNILFADEFNASTSVSLGLVVGDKLTVTGTIEYANFIDAGLDGNFTISAVNGSTISAAYTGLQAFVFSADLFNAISNAQRQELFNNVNIDVSGFTAPIDGAYTVLAFDVANMALITQEAFVANKPNDGDGLIFVSELYDIGEFRAVLANRSNNNDLAKFPIIKTSPNSEYVGFFDNGTLDATNSTPRLLPYLSEGSWKNGTFTITGAGSIGTEGQQTYTFTHVIYLLPISLFQTSAGGVGLINSGAILADVDQGNDLTGLEYQLEPVLKSTNLGASVSFKGLFTTELGMWRMFDSSLDGISVITQDNYSITNLVIERTSDSVASGVPIITQGYTVTFDIENTADSPFSDTNTMVKVGHEALPERYDYANLPTGFPANPDYEKVSIWDRALTTLGDAPIAGEATGDAACITAYSATFVDATKASISYQVAYTANAQTQLLANSFFRFTLWATVQDHNGDLTLNDRTNPLVFFGEGVEVLVDTTPVTTTSKVIEFPFTSLLVDFATAEAYPTNNLVINNVFSLDWASRPNLRIENIVNQIILKETVTGEVIILDADTIPVNTFPLIDNEYPDAQYTASRGYQIPSAEVRTNVTLVNRTDLDAADVHNFELEFPFKIGWQTWINIVLQTIPSELIDALEPNNGLNHFWFRLQTITNWRIFHRMEVNMSDGITFTQTFDNELTLYDYESNTDTVSVSIKSFTEDGVTQLFDGSSYLDTSGVGKKSQIVSSLELGTTYLTLAAFEVEFFLEEKQQGTNTNIQRISSVNGKIANAFEGITDINLIDKSISSATLIGKALVLGDQVRNFVDATLYASYFIKGDPIAEWIFQTDSDIPTDAPFDPSVLTTGGETVTWNLIGGYAETINSLSISVRTGLPGTPSTLTAAELNGVTQDVSVTFSTNNPANITEVLIENDNVVGSLDVSIFSNVTVWSLDSNPGMTQVVHSASSAIITDYTVTDNDITGVLNLSNLVVGGIFLVNGNANMTGITLGASSTVFSFFRANNCDLTGTLNLSMLSGLGGQIRLGVNPNLTAVTFPTSSVATSEFFIQQCDLTGTLDFSGMTGDHDDFRVFTNSSLTAITNPSTSFIMEMYSAHSCDLTGTLDMTPISNFAVDFDVHGNSNLTDITNPSTSTVLTDYLANSCDLGYIDFTVFSGTNDDINIQLGNNNMTAAEVNEILVNLDDTGWIDGTLNIAGTNAAPDGTSGGFDGLTAKTNLIAKWTSITTS